MNESHPRQRSLAVVGVAGAAIAMGVAFALSGARIGPIPGPLQPTDTVISQGTWADPGSTVSMVIQFRGETPVTATLEGVSLVEPDVGLELVGAGILEDVAPIEDFLGDSFPSGPIRPIAGTTISTTPGDRTGDVFFNLGIRISSDEQPQSMRGVWLDYRVGPARYRALLPWLLTICPGNPSQTCTSLPGEEFIFPRP